MMTIPMATLILFLCFCALPDAAISDAAPFNAEFFKTLLDIDETAWQKLIDPALPPTQDLERLALLAKNLARWVPKSLLQKHRAETFPLTSGDVFLLEGNVVSVKKYPAVYHCQMRLNKGAGYNDMTVDLFTASIPQAWQLDRPIQERSAALGVYLKAHNGIPVFAAPSMQWYPDTWLGNLGFDAASLDQVPVSRVTDLEQQDEETNRRMFKFTEADREPFYGLLRAISATPAGWLEEEAARQLAERPIDVTDLFNHPQETRCRPILLSGTAKRIVPTTVADREVQAVFGIEQYYQIYLFTDQSQGNPIVVCVRFLPEGMPAGDAEDFSESITVAAVPYKLWIYETQKEPHYAPVLIGRSVTRHPQSAAQPQAPKSVEAFSVILFFILILCWFACRWRSKFRAS